MAQVFISHSSTDKAVARELMKRFESIGHDVWLDSQEILPGHAISQRIKDAIQKADVVTVILSPEALKSGWVHQEVRLARELMQAGYGKLLLPILIRPCNPIPPELADIHYANFQEDYEAGWRMVVQSIQQWNSQPQRVDFPPRASATGNPQDGFEPKSSSMGRSRSTTLPWVLSLVAVGVLVAALGILNPGGAGSSRRAVQPQLQVGTRPPTPAHGARDLPELRGLHRVRPLQDHEGEMEADRLPMGTFGFVARSELHRLRRARVHASQRAGDFEVHMLAGAGLFVVGYTSNEARNKLSSAGAKMQITFSPSATQVNPALAAVPFDRLRQVSLKTVQGQGLVDLQLGSY